MYCDSMHTPRRSEASDLLRSSGGKRTLGTRQSTSGRWSIATSASLRGRLAFDSPRKGVLSITKPKARHNKSSMATSHVNHSRCTIYGELPTSGSGGQDLRPSDVGI